MDALLLPEHLLLLALRDDKGSVVQCSAMALDYGLAGAILLELSTRQCVGVNEKSVVATQSGTSGDALLDIALKNIRDSKRVRKLAYWIARPNSLVPKLRQGLLDRLVARGILRREEHHVLWLIPYNRYPEADGAPERDIRRRVHEVLLHGAEADEHTATLIPLIHACELAREVFPNQPGRQITKQLKEFSQGEQVSKAIANQVAEETVALIAGVIAANTVAISATS